MDIYLDNAATTPPLREVVEVVTDAMQRYYANPSSLHRGGEEAARLLKQSRRVAADALGVQAGEVFFTAGATEANNTALRGVCREYRNRGRHIIASAIEHPSVKDVLLDLQDEGFEVTFLPVDERGVLRLEDFRRAFREDTVLVSVMLVNNEMGAVQPVADLGRVLSSRPKTIFHVDAVQGFGKTPLEPKAWGVDLMSLSAHKFHGPKGVGLLYKREGLSLPPLIMGGGQEGGLRSGTENLPGVVGMAKAMQGAKKHERESLARLWQLKEKLVAGLQHLEGVHLNGAPEDREASAPHILNLSLPGVMPEVLVHSLESEGLYVSTKSACSSKEEKPSDVLLALGLPHERALSALRLSLSYLTKEEEMEKALQILQRVIPQLQSSLRGVK